jgi:hypothetical protein
MRLGSVRWHARVCRVAALLCHLSSSPPRHRRMSKNPFNVTYTPAPTIAALTVLRIAQAHTRSTTTLSRAITSLPLSLRRPAFPHAMRGYKIRPLPFVCPCPHRCLPPVSHPGHASPLFLSLHRCQAASRAFCPRVQVPEHPPTSVKLLEVWPTSLTTRVARHRLRTPVRSATVSSSYSDALRSPFLVGPMHGIVMIPWGSTFPSSGRWALAACRTMLERWVRTAGCRASRERSHACSRTLSGRCARAGLAGLWAMRAGRRFTPEMPRAT